MQQRNNREIARSLKDIVLPIRTFCIMVTTRVSMANFGMQAPMNHYNSSGRKHFRFCDEIKRNDM